MYILEHLLTDLPNGKVIEVAIGLFWTAVLVDVEGKLSCGLAATQHNPEFEHGRRPAVADAGELERRSALELASLVRSDSFTEVSVGLATVNALLSPPERLVDLPAEEYILHHGKQANVALIGHFPFVDALRPRVRQLWVLELNPKEDDLPASQTAQIVPQADILAITSTTLINHTFDEVFQYRKPGAKVMLLGPSTPLSPRLFDLGIDVLSGSIVEDAAPVMRLTRQGASFRQFKGRGVRLVTAEREPESKRI